MSATRGRFLVLDGIDGSGKSTQAALLVESLRARGREVVHLREPGSTAFGESVRVLLLAREQAIDPGAEALLFCAARRQMLLERVAPELARGAWIVCERFHGSTLAYQGVAGGVGFERVAGLLDAWAAEPRPDLVLVLDLAPSSVAARQKRVADRFEARGLAYQELVAKGFQLYAERGAAARPSTLAAAGRGRRAHPREVDRVLR
jgi:dTMP kinase